MDASCFRPIVDACVDQVSDLCAELDEFVDCPEDFDVEKIKAVISDILTRVQGCRDEVMDMANSMEDEVDTALRKVEREIDDMKEDIEELKGYFDDLGVYESFIDKHLRRR